MSTDGTCRGCSGRTLLPVLSLGLMPLTDDYPGSADEQEGRYPLDVAFCPDCSLLQILEAPPPEAIFVDYSYYSSVSATLLRHSREHALELIASRGLGPGSLVVEVASNDGYLLRNFVEAGVPVLGIDPARGPAAAAEAIGVPTLQTFFGAESARALRSEGRRADVLIAKNVLAHVPELNGFVEGVATILSETGIAEFEVPYVRDMIDQLEFDTIYHEHLCYFSVTSLRSLFARHGLAVQRVRHLPIHGGSLRITVGRAAEGDESVRRFLDAESAAGITGFGYYRDFADRVSEVCRAVRSKLSELKGAGHRLAGYGAAAKGTILLNAARLGPDILDYVADKSPHKQGRWMPGARIPIVGPERLLQDRPDYVLLLAWNFRNEILMEQQAYLDGGGRFIVPIPWPVVVGEPGHERAIDSPSGRP
ncbi:MAG TPA: class I SAM-dependent methyltransferase [Actinomycetota bacterium]